MAVPPGDFSTEAFVDFQRVQTNRRPSPNRDIYSTALEKVIGVTGDQLLGFRMTPMLKVMGTSLRAVLYQHALSRGRSG